MMRMIRSRRLVRRDFILKLGLGDWGNAGIVEL
jgi:hypothetical protein